MSGRGGGLWGSCRGRWTVSTVVPGGNIRSERGPVIKVGSKFGQILVKFGRTMYTRSSAGEECSANRYHANTPKGLIY